MNNLITNNKYMKIVDEAGPYNSVQLLPTEFAGKQTGNHVVINLNDGRRAAVAHVGNNYNLVSNARAKEIGDEIMSQSGISWNSVNHIWTGRKYIHTYMSDEPAIELPEVEDVIRYGFRIENSYDGTSKLRAAVMAYVLSCSNGMVSDRLWGAFGITHTTGAADYDLDDAQQRMITGMTRLCRFRNAFNAMTQEPFSFPALQRIAVDPRVPPTFIGKFVNQCNENYAIDYGMSKWQAMQIGTAMLRESNKISKFRTLEGWTERFLEPFK